MHNLRSILARCGVASTVALGGVTLAGIAPSAANPDGDNVVINEVYGGGGNSGAPLRSDFVELYNPTDADISLSGMSLQYRSSSGSPGGAAVPLTGTVPAGGYFLIKAADGSNTAAAALPTPDAETSFAMSGTNGQVLLINGTSFTGSGDVAGNASLIDAVGYGTSTTFETAATPGLSNGTSAGRTTAGADTDNNSADFTVGAPTPTNSGGPVDPPDPDPVTATIAEIQGTGAASPMVGAVATTTGVVTAVYPEGGLAGFYIQTGGTGGATDATPGASDGLFIYSPGVDFSTLALGDSVEVTGPVSEFRGTTEITADSIEPIGALEPVTPLAIAYPTTEADREAHEGELLAPTDDFTVTDVYSINQYAEIGLATGNTPLTQPTEVEDAQSGDVSGVAAENARRAVTLDDGASINFFSGDSRNIALPWLSKANPIRVGAPVELQAPVILEYRNDTWKFQPQQQVKDEGKSVAVVENTRLQNMVPREVGGDLKLATFNVLNYFNTTGADWVAAGNSCTYYTDRLGNPVSNNDCGPTGPRGAAEAEDLERQQAKIVTAINLMDADVVSLEEIENSIALGEADRDDALAALTTALNAAAGEERWAFVPSPPASELPPVAEQDVIRTAFIYNPSAIETVGVSDVLADSPAFGNAREPLAQVFKQKGAADNEAFGVIVNHFKSKGSGVDDGTGQGNANPDRIAQAEALVGFANDFAAERGIDATFLTGDFNSYSQEDPMQVLYGAGFAKVESTEDGDDSYSFDGLSGSLDHVLANPAALERVTGADVWEINADESVAFQYSRHNYNLTDFFEADNPFAASDHNPEVVGLTGSADDTVFEVSAKVNGKVRADKTRAKVMVSVTRDGETVREGSVVVLDGDRELAAGEVRKGKTQLKLPTFDEPGTYELTVRYTDPNGRTTDQVVTVVVTR